MVCSVSRNGMKMARKLLPTDTTRAAAPSVLIAVESNIGITCHPLANDDQQESRDKSGAATNIQGNDTMVKVEEQLFKIVIGRCAAGVAMTWARRSLFHRDGGGSVQVVVNVQHYVNYPFLNLNIR